MSKPAKKTQKNSSSYARIFGVLTVFGVIGLAASFVLAAEEIHLLQDPNAILSCSFNVILNCSDVMRTWQAGVFGFPNMFIGLIGFPIVITIGLLGLSRVTFPRWFSISMEIGLFVAAIFAYWLFFSSLYIIQVLCPWCLFVTFTMTMLLAASTVYSIRENTFGLAQSTLARLRKFVDKGYYQLLVASWIVLMVVLVFMKFGAALFAM